MLDLALAAKELEHIDPKFTKMAWDIVNREGGYVNDPKDSGGATNHGVSLKHAKDQGKVFDLNGDGKVDAEDIKLITPQMAVVDFLMEYLIDPQLNKLPPCIQACAFDASVNNGPGGAVRLVQMAVNNVAIVPWIKEDGSIGPATLTAAYKTCDLVGETEFVNALVDARCMDYSRIAMDPKKVKFLDGWLNRAETFRRN